MNINKTENTFVLGLFLAFTGLIAAFLLAVFSRITAEPIAKTEMESANRSLAAVMPPFKSKRTTVFKNITFTGVYDEKNTLIGVAGETCSKGYGGDIKVLVGMNADGSIRTVIVLENKETPGLGSNVCVRKEQKTLGTIFSKSAKSSDTLAPNRILDYYSGKIVSADAPAWQVTKDGGECPYLTGATVSSRALCKAVYAVASEYSRNKEVIQNGLLNQEGN